MSQLEKLVIKLLRHPKEVSFEEVVQLLDTFGYNERISSGGSHRAFVKTGHPVIIVPTIKGRHVKGVYIKMIIDKLDLEEWYETRYRA